MGKKNKDFWIDKFDKIIDLGEGGNARVFKVKEKTSENEYALKCLYNRSKEKIVRFNDEIKIMSENAESIEGIIPIINYSKIQFWYTMPIAIPIITYIEDKKLNYEVIITGIIQLADTLLKLHEKGISHRDIKPSNIYYYNNRFSFGDFGLVEFPDNPNDFTKSDKGLGAIFTIAPEMKRDPKHADGKKADVFSLAKTVWMLLTGDEKGFDGTYDFLDESISLRFNRAFKTIHLVELEEALTNATDNNPDKRPTIDEFKNQLQRWLEVINDFEKAQLSAWKFLNKYLFGDNAPESSVWRKREKIIYVLNVIGTMPLYNHMLLSDCGGLDFGKAELANEDGCIYIYDTIGYCFIVKPKSLYYEGFEDTFKWNYFLLEIDKLDPILKNSNEASYEFLVEDYPAHYVSDQYEQYGVYDYDSGEKFPEGYKCVKRYLKGKFLIVLKNGPYNSIPSTYDGRHGMCSNAEFRDYLEKVIALVNYLVNQGCNEEVVLKSNLFKVNPFVQEVPQERHMRKKGRKEGKEFISSHYKQWCFKQLFDDVGLQKNIRFYITYENNSFLLFSNDKIEYLCEDGFIKTLSNEQLDEIHYVFDRKEVLITLEKCNRFIQEKCEEENLCMPEFEYFFSVNIGRCGKPKHIFSKDEIEVLMKNADDRKNNMLVIDENGYPEIIQNIDEYLLYPVSHESWNAGNLYVGKYSNLSSLDDDYISSLQGWLLYLKHNKHISMDYVHDNRDEESLLREIRKFYES